MQVLSNKQKGDKLQKHTLFTWYGWSTVTDCVKDHALSYDRLACLLTVDMSCESDPLCKIEMNRMLIICRFYCKTGKASLLVS